jgi:hypothetical protein
MVADNNCEWGVPTLETPWHGMERLTGMTRHKLIPALLAIVVGAIAALTMASPANADGVFVRIHRVNTDLCLAAAAGGNGAAIIQVQCDASSFAQGWKFEQVSGTRYKFVNQLGFCMNAFGPNQNETPILLIDCVRVSNEEWNTGLTLPRHSVQIQSRAGNRDNGFCVDVPGGDFTIGLAVRMWTCNGTGAQLFDVGF